jgi:tRNA pseudouridine38-40 synthase
MPRYKLTIAYDGTEFHGWQRQEPADAPPLRTVQGVVQEAVRDLLRQPVEVVGASRTDSGAMPSRRATSGTKVVR